MRKICLLLSLDEISLARQSMPEISTGHQLQQLTKNHMRSLISLCTVALLVGCASAPKPTMPEENYRFFAQKWAALNICGLAGRMSVENAAFGKNHVVNWAGSWSFDAVRFDSMSRTYDQPPSEQLCNQINIDVAGWRQAVQNANIANAQSQANQQQLLIQLNNFGKSNTTYCNSIGNQTICSKY